MGADKPVRRVAVELRANIFERDSVMNKLSLKMKLGVGFGVLLAILITMGVVSYFSVQKLTQLSAYADSMTQEERLAAHVQDSFNRQRLFVARILLRDGQAERDHFQESGRELAGTMGTLEKLLVTEEGRRLLGKTQHAIEQYDPILQRTLGLQSAGKTGEAVDLILGAEANAARAEVDQCIADFTGLTARLKTAARNQQAASQASAVVWIVGLAVAGLVVGLLVAVLIVRSVAGSVSRMLTVIQEVAANNLAIEDMEVTSQDELGQAATALNSMKNNLRAIMQSIAGTAEHVASASEEIAASATQTANGSEAQRDQVHQVATAMQEMAATVHEVSENSDKAADSARQASETARQGGTIVEGTLTRMRDIAGSVRDTAQKVQELGSRSDQIGKIVGVIDDIADQTNLLALNAAIEAARAGEQGRGFAVVADEVRKLAERTTKATKEIAEMIEQVQTETRAAVEKMQSGTQQVEKGVEVTAKAGDALQQIIGQTDHVGEMVTHIATAATEQSSATEQVSSNMDQINRLVAESAEGAQQSAKACEQLSNLALELQQLMARFKLDEQSSGTISGGYRSARRVAADPVRARAALASTARPPLQHVLHHAEHEVVAE
jgi:methyl-accepting chemotaxis protein